MLYYLLLFFYLAGETAGKGIFTILLSLRQKPFYGHVGQFWIPPDMRTIVEKIGVLFICSLAD